jgi:hypothetical protein
VFGLILVDYSLLVCLNFPPILLPLQLASETTSDVPLSGNLRWLEALRFI